MIGQKELLDKLDKQFKDDLFPRFAIFIGIEGSGKKTLMREFSHKHWDNVYELEDVKVDTIRTMISDSYNITIPTAIIVPDMNKMSANARGALLKVTEEPPNDVTFLMSALTSDSISETIRSRAVTYYMRPYSRDELLEYIHSVPNALDDEDCDLILQVCNNISEIKNCLKIDLHAVFEYANKLIDSIGKVSTANAIKSSNKVAFKDEKDKFDLLLLWKFVCYNLRVRIIDAENDDDRKLNADLLFETMQRMSDLSMSAVPMQSTYDEWVLNCRRIINGTE